MTQVEIIIAHLSPMLARWASAQTKSGGVRRFTFAVSDGSKLHLALEVEYKGYTQIKRAEMIPGSALDTALDLLSRFNGDL